MKISVFYLSFIIKRYIDCVTCHVTKIIIRDLIPFDTQQIGLALEEFNKYISLSGDMLNTIIVYCQTKNSQITKSTRGSITKTSFPGGRKSLPLILLHQIFQIVQDN